MTLGSYLADAGRKRWIDGTHDCCTFAADWVILCGYPDPMARWRGAYSTAAEALAIIAEAGGLVALWVEACRSADVPSLGEGEALREGDIGICTVTGEAGAVENGGIFTGERWVFRAPRGLIGAPVDPRQVVRVWRP